MKRSGSSVPQFTQRIPADVRQRAVGLKLDVPCGGTTIPIRIAAKTQSIRFSLRTTIPSEVKAREAAAITYLETVWQTLRNAATPTALNHKQATALAGDLYRAWAAGADTERTIAVEHTPQGWKRVYTHTEEDQQGYFEAALRHLERLKEAGETEDLERPLGPLVDRLLLRRGIAEVDSPSRDLLLSAFWRALKDAMEVRMRNAEGDYSPDPKAERFPEWKPPTVDTKASPKVPLSGLLEGWWKERELAGVKPSALESYRNTLEVFSAYLKHDDAARVGADDVVGFKEHLLELVNPRTRRRLSAKTIRDNYLSAVRTLFAWGVANRKLTNNPAAGITIKLGVPRRVRGKGFTDAEARAILKAASTYVPGRETPRTAAAKRWVPWLCAYTGARVGELTQLRKQDVRREGIEWVIRITPEAGTVKTNEARDVVLHPHLIELGFPEFVERAPEGHLFLKPSKSGDVLGPLQGVKNRLQEFAREVITDKDVMPNHGWRHRFKTVGMQAGIDSRILNAIQGHAASSVGDTYGEVTVQTQAEAIRKLPRIEIWKGAEVREGLLI